MNPSGSSADRDTVFVSAAEWAARGRAARRRAPRSSHAGWGPAADRPDPVALLEEQAESRVADLVPDPPRADAGLAVHVLPGRRPDHGGGPRRDPGVAASRCSSAATRTCSNFGLFASPERQMLFDINDFDETLPGPWEWDVKRLAASFEIAARDLGFSPSDRRDVVTAGVREYREAMRRAAKMRALDAWYAHLTVDDLKAWIAREVRAGRLSKREAGEAAAVVAKAETRVHERSFRRLAGEVDGKVRIIADPPLDRADRRSRALGHDARADGGMDARARAELPPLADAMAPPDGAVPVPRHGAQGRGRGQRGHARLDPPLRGAPAPGAAVPAGEGGAGLGAGAVRRQEPVRQPRPPRRRGPAADAGGERHLPRLAALRRPGRPDARLLRAAAARLEGQRQRGELPGAGGDALRPAVRRDPGPGARAPRRPGGDRVLPRAGATRSTGRSPTSPSPTRTRTSATTRPS